MKRVEGLIRDNTSIIQAYNNFFAGMYEKDWLSTNRLDAELIQRFIAYEVDSEIVSFLAYEGYQLSGKLEIIGAWTHPDYRRQGLYSKLFDRLKQLGKKNRYSYIRSGYHKANTISQAMQEKQGRTIIADHTNFISTRLDL